LLGEKEYMSTQRLDANERDHTEAPVVNEEEELMVE
jgi:hypothetical protein